ncbi:MAG: AEC family transporter [Clostridiales bacterium]|nr:AEC family transporter [Clostridiales bacterium]
MTAVYLAIQMTLLMGVGFFARKIHLVDEKFPQSLGNFLYHFGFTCVVLKAMMSADLSNIGEMGMLILISLGTIGVMFLFGSGFNMFLRKKDDMAKITTVDLMFVNFTFMAFPIIEALYGEKGSLYIAAYTIPVRILFYVVSPLILATAKRAAEDVSSNPGTSPDATSPSANVKVGKEIRKVLLSAPVLAIPIGFALSFLPGPLPSPVMNSISAIAAVVTPMGMALCGMRLAEVPIREAIKNGRIWHLTALRLLAAPAIALGLMFILTRFISPDPILVKMCVIYCALPAAASTTIIAMNVGSDSIKAAQSVFLTTALSVCTLPLWVFIVDKVF